MLVTERSLWQVSRVEIVTTNKMSAYHYELETVFGLTELYLRGKKFKIQDSARKLIVTL